MTCTTKRVFEWVWPLLAAAVVVFLAGEAYAQNAEPALLFDDPPPPVAPDVVSRDGEGRVTVRAVRLTSPLTVDGRLDDEIYRTTPAIGDFVQQEPHEGDPASERTDVWLFFDDRHVYVGARLWYTDPSRIVANEMRRDNRNVTQNDHLTVVLDTFRDRRTGMFFQTNALGAVRDGLVSDDGASISPDWDTVWTVRSERFAEGWTTEFAIPFRSLRYRSQGPQVWGVNLRRAIRAKNEMVHLTRIPASYGQRGVNKVSSAAALVGLETPAGGRNLEIKPYAISSVSTDRLSTPIRSNEPDGDVGLDAKYGVTKGLTFDFSYNTDFAQVEDDEQQVNLTRFSLFFPEKREFFLEGQSIFEFAGARTSGAMWAGGGGGGDGGGRFAIPSQTPILFFSRRIGLNRGQTVPIDVGGRLTGRAGKYSVGLLNIQTEKTLAASAAATNFSVVRLRRDVLQRSSVGVIATHRDPGVEGPANTVYGLDANFALHQDFEMGGYFARSRTPGQGSDDTSYRAVVNYSGDRYGAAYEHLKVGDDFDPEIGFLRRQDFRRHFGLLRFSPRIGPRARRLQRFRKFSYEATLDYLTDNAGRVETREARAAFGADFETGDAFDFSVVDAYEFLPEAFEIVPGVTLPVGPYRYTEARATLRMAPQRRVAGFLALTAGGFYDGDRVEMAYNGRVELSSRLSVEPRVSFNFVNLPGGEFTTKLVSARTTYTLTPRAFVGALVQYNSSTETITSNVRFRWEYRPGSDLFIVYSEGRDTLVGGFPGLQTRAVVVKLTRLFRF